MGIEAFIIHLARASGRAPVVEAARRGVMMPCTVVDAVDGQLLGEVELGRTYAPNPLYLPPYPFRLGRGEIACFLSHRKVWQMIVDRGLEWGLVLEDDVAVSSEVLAGTVATVRDWGDLSAYVSLQTRPLPMERKVLYQGSGGCLVEISPAPLRTSGQIVGRHAAKRLLECTGHLDRPVDVFLQMTWESGVPVVCADPSGIKDWPEPTGGSVAQTKRNRGVLALLRREVARTIYRHRIARIARGK